MNDHRARAEAQAAASRRFLQALSAGSVGVIDRLGTKLQVGQQILFHPPYDLVFDVLAINPELNPNMPSGLLTVTLAVSLPVPVQANTPWAGAIVVRQARKLEGSHVEAPIDPPAGPRPIPAEVQSEGPDGDREDAGGDQAIPEADSGHDDEVGSSGGV